MSRQQLGRFRHVGVAVRDVDAAAERFAALLGAVPDAEAVHDAEQGVRLRLIRLGDLQIELLEPAAEPSPLDSVIKHGLGIYHVCYEVDDLDAELSRLQASGVRTVSPPKPAAAFGGCRVAFVVCQGLMIELLESPGPRPPTTESSRPGPE